MKLRKAKNLTSKELGEQIGITESGVLGYENKITYPSRDVLLRLVDIFGNDVLCDDYSRFITSEYGPIIKKWRINNNFTCEQAANYIGIKTRALYCIESMTYIISRKIFEQHKPKLIEIIFQTQTTIQNTHKTLN